MRTGGGTTITSKLIEHVKTGDKVWVFISEYGKVQKIEPLSCKHNTKQSLEVEEKLESPIDYSELDSVE